MKDIHKQHHFIKFLKENDIYYQYKKNRKAFSIKNIEDFHSIFNSSTTNFILGAFKWIDTIEGQAFWNIQHNNWQVYLIKHG